MIEYNVLEQWYGRGSKRALQEIGKKALCSDAGRKKSLWETERQRRQPARLACPPGDHPSGPSQSHKLCSWREPRKDPGSEDPDRGLEKHHRGPAAGVEGGEGGVPSNTARVEKADPSGRNGAVVRGQALKARKQKNASDRNKGWQPPRSIANENSTARGSGC